MGPMPNTYQQMLAKVLGNSPASQGAGANVFKGVNGKMIAPSMNPAMSPVVNPMFVGVRG